MAVRPSPKRAPAEIIAPHSARINCSLGTAVGRAILQDLFGRGVAHRCTWLLPLKHVNASTERDEQAAQDDKETSAATPRPHAELPLRMIPTLVAPSAEKAAAAQSHDAIPLVARRKNWFVSLQLYPSHTLAMLV